MLVRDGYAREVRSELTLKVNFFNASHDRDVQLKDRADVKRRTLKWSSVTRQRIGWSVGRC